MGSCGELVHIIMYCNSFCILFPFLLLSLGKCSVSLSGGSGHLHTCLLSAHLSVLILTCDAFDVFG